VPSEGGNEHRYSFSLHTRDVILAGHLQELRSASGFVTLTGLPSRKAIAFSMLCP
jgi:hypothetical protein